ncbi:MAG TPA: DUF1304 domain-containing protein [Myxococcaceae bacterium]|nr:DUF1304 domain-containing protein [Myxococcaceae bacterium]
MFWLSVVFAGLAALLHVLFFVMESIRWRHPRVWKTFGIQDQATADTLWPMAYNQGFYNLFLAIGAAVGLVLLLTGNAAAGRTLTLFCLASMFGAGLVLSSTGPGYRRGALIQGTPPLIGIILMWLSTGPG